MKHLSQEVGAEGSAAAFAMRTLGAGFRCFAPRAKHLSRAVSAADSGAASRRWREAQETFSPLEVDKGACAHALQ
jgi:hypothetical protein